MRRKEYEEIVASSDTAVLRSLLGMGFRKMDGACCQWSLVLDDTRYVACFESLNFA